MLSENIKRLRKQKGYSQETLAHQLNVVRQTISKWEKGYSVPDADMLERMAELFEVPVSELLGKETSFVHEASDSIEIVQQLTILNEQLAKQNNIKKRTFWTTLISIFVLTLTGIMIYIFMFASFKATDHTSHEEVHTDFNCTLDGISYSYNISYDEQYNILTAQIEDHFKVHGGSYEITHHAKKHSIHHK